MKPILALSFFMLLAACGSPSEPLDRISSSAQTHSSSLTTSSSSTDTTAWKYPVDPTTVVRDSFVDERDGKVYKTVKIGELTWMAQNLDYRFTDSGYYPGAFKCTNDSLSACDRWGALYGNLQAFFTHTAGEAFAVEYEAYQSKAWKFWQGLCPIGWHIPDSTEFLELVNNVGGIDSIYRLREPQTWPDSLGGGTDEFGFKWIAVMGNSKWNNRVLYRPSDSALASTDYDTRYYSESTPGFMVIAAARKKGFEFFHSGGIGAMNDMAMIPMRCVKDY
jgi:uncharacterized protein (TIGR02145 family)